MRTPELTGAARVRPEREAANWPTRHQPLAASHSPLAPTTHRDGASHAPPVSLSEPTPIEIAFEPSEEERRWLADHPREEPSDWWPDERSWVWTVVHWLQELGARVQAVEK